MRLFRAFDRPHEVAGDATDGVSGQTTSFVNAAGTSWRLSTVAAWSIASNKGSALERAGTPWSPLSDQARRPVAHYNHGNAPRTYRNALR